MKKYVKEIDGEKVYKTRQQIVISKNGMSTYNPTEQMILDDGWVEYIDPVYEETVEDFRRYKINEITNYDQSNEVNEFYIQDIPVWLDKNTRSGLKLRFEAEKVMLKEYTTLWYDNQEFVLPLDSAIQMLYAIEVYASECYDNTQKHIAEVLKLETKEDIELYDFRVGYPEKLRL